MLFLLKYWKFFAGVALFIVLIIGYNFWVNHQRDIGRDEKTVYYEKIIQDQKVEASKILAKETAKVQATKDALQEAKNNQEVRDGKNEKTIQILNAKLRDLADANGRLRDPKNGRRVSGTFSANNNPPNPGDCPDNGTETSGLLSAELSRLLQKLTAEADEVNLAYISCREDSIGVRAVLNKGLKGK